jgi:hypothetical protein
MHNVKGAGSLVNQLRAPNTSEAGLDFRIDNESEGAFQAHLREESGHRQHLHQGVFMSIRSV